MSWLFGGAAPAAATAAVPAGATAATALSAAPAAAGAAAGGVPAMAANAALQTAGPGAGMMQGLGQFGQGFGQGSLGIGQAPNTWQGMLGQVAGQGAHQPMPQAPGFSPMQIGQQPLGGMFQRPSQGMDPQMLQQIGMMIAGLLRR